MQYTYQDFFHCSQQFLNWLILMAFRLLLFLFHFFHIGETFPFVDFFHLGKQKRLGQDWVNGGWGTGGHVSFSQKVLNTQPVWADALINQPS